MQEPHLLFEVHVHLPYQDRNNLLPLGIHIKLLHNYHVCALGLFFLSEMRLLTLCRFHSKIITHSAIKKLLYAPPSLFPLEVKSPISQSCCILIAIKLPNYYKCSATTDPATLCTDSNILKVTIITNFQSVPGNIQSQEIIQPLLPFCSPLHSVLLHFNIIWFWSTEFKDKAMGLTKHLEMPAF